MQNLSTLLAFAVFAFSSPALADRKAEAMEHVQRATAHHGNGKFVEALDELTRAFELDPEPGLLYAIAQVHVKLERCSEAITFYDRFLATNPEPKAASAAHEAIAICNTKVAQPKPADPTPTKPPDVTRSSDLTEAKPFVLEPSDLRSAKPPDLISAKVEAVAVNETPSSGRRAWYKDPIGGAFVGAGLASGVMGVLFYRSASSDIDAAESATSYGSSEQLVDRASSKRTYAAMAGVAGIALVGAGIVRYVLSGSSKERGLAIAPAVDGAAVTWGGRF